MSDGIKERYEWKGLKIVFAEKNGIPYSSVISGATVLKSCSNESMEKVKDEVRDFLSDKKNIENIIKRNHERSLANSGIKNPEKIGIYKAEPNKRKRETHCYGCGHDLSSFEDFSCKKCNWLLCTCGACGCGYHKY